VTISATAFVFGLTDCYTKAAKLIVSLVRRDLQTNFFAGIRPPAHLENLACRFTVMEAALPRMCRDRGTRFVAQKLQRWRTTYRRLFNGDLRGSAFQHFCYEDGCCGNHQLEVAVRDITGFILEVVFTGLGLDKPSEERWGTVEPHLNRQALGQTTFGILRRIVCGICGGAELPTDLTLDDYHAESGRKKQKSHDFHAVEPDCTSTLLTSVFTMAPLAYLSARVQKLDDEGGGLLALVERGPGGILTRCQQWLWEIVNFGTESRNCLSVPALLWHARADAHYSCEKQLITRVRAMSTQAGAAIFVRLTCKYQKCPFFRWLHGDLDAANCGFFSTCRWFSYMNYNGFWKLDFLIGRNHEGIYGDPVMEDLGRHHVLQGTQEIYLKPPECPLT
jgi:hypothetical protein